MSQMTKDLGFNAKGLLGHDDRRRAAHSSGAPTTPVKTIGEETVDGVETTHYRGTIDPKAPAVGRLAEADGAGVQADRRVGRRRRAPAAGQARLHDQGGDQRNGACARDADDEAARLRRDRGRRGAHGGDDRRRDRAGGGRLMQVAIKIWRVDPQSGERALKEYEVEAPEWATLLDVLDIVKDRHDGSLAYRKSCRMMICGACGDARRRRRGARLQDAHGRHRAVGPRAGGLGHGQPARRQGPRRRHGRRSGPSTAPSTRTCARATPSRASRSTWSRSSG